MTNKFKKVIAGLMAATSLATSVIGISASAETGYRTLDNGTGCLSVTSTSVYASTYSDNKTYKEVVITALDPSATLPNAQTGYKTSVNITVYGSYDRAWSYHKAGSSGTLCVT